MDADRADAAPTTWIISRARDAGKTQSPRTVAMLFLGLEGQVPDPQDVRAFPFYATRVQADRLRAFAGPAYLVEPEVRFDPAHEDTHVFGDTLIATSPPGEPGQPMTWRAALPLVRALADIAESSPDGEAAGVALHALRDAFGADAARWMTAMSEGAESVSTAAEDEVSRRVLAAPMQDNDAGAATVESYLRSLAAAMWFEGEGFSGKRPFGNSGWYREVHATVIAAGLSTGTLDADGCIGDEGDVAEVVSRAVELFGRIA